MNRVISAGTWLLALSWLAWLAGCAGHEDAPETDVETAVSETVAPEPDSLEVALQLEAPAKPDARDDAAVESEAPLEPEDDPYLISVEIPVDDLLIADGEDLAVGELIDERTAFRAADFHLYEVVLIARSGNGGSAELMVDAWQSGAVGIPSGADETWYEVRIPAVADSDEGTAWVVDFTGAVDLNLLVAVLEPRPGVVPTASATVRQVALDPVDTVSGEAVDAGEVVTSIEVVDAATAEPAVHVTVDAVEVVERPVYRTRNVYYVDDRPRVVRTYSPVWIYQPAHHYVFRHHQGWSYRYFAGTWDWRCYDLSYRHPHHHRSYGRSRDDHRLRSDRRHRSDGDRHDGRRDGRDRDVERRDRRRDDDGRRRREGRNTVVADQRPGKAVGIAQTRRIDPVHLRQRLAGRQDAEPRDRNDLRGVDATTRPKNPRLRASQRRDEAERRANEPRIAQPTRANPFRRVARSDATTPEPRVTPTRQRPRRADRGEPEPRVVSSPPRTEPRTERNVRARAFEKRDDQPQVAGNRVTTHRSNRRQEVLKTTAQRFEPRFGEPGLVSEPHGVPGTQTPNERRSRSARAATPSQAEARTNVRTRSLQRPTEREPVRAALRRTVEPRRAPAQTNAEVRSPDARANVRTSNVRTRAFQSETRRAAPRQTPQRSQPRVQRENGARTIRTAPPRQVERPRQTSPRPSTSRPSAPAPKPRRSEPRQVEQPRVSPPPPEEPKSRSPRLRGSDRQRR